MPTGFWNEYLNIVVRTYTSALNKGTVHFIEPRDSAAQTSATYTQQAAQERMSKGHKLTEADRHTCDFECTRRRRAAVEATDKAAAGHVSVETVQSNAYMKVTPSHCRIFHSIAT